MASESRGGHDTAHSSRDGAPDGGGGAKVSSILGPKPGRRTSLGGFVLIEDDDFSNAMGKLLGMIPVQGAAHAAVELPQMTYRADGAQASGPGSGYDNSSRRTPGRSGPQGRTSGSIAAGAGAGNETASDSPYWRYGNQLDINSLMSESKAVRPRNRIGAVDHAISDPNPMPARDSLAVPPPPEIMQPAGNIIVNHRIETALLHNEVATAQKISVSHEKLYALLEDSLFQEACVAVGFKPNSLLPQHRSKFKVNPENGRNRRKDEIDQLVAKAEIDRVKKLALVLTDYRILLAEREKRKRREEKQQRTAALLASMNRSRDLNSLDTMSIPSMADSLVDSNWNGDMHSTLLQSPAGTPPPRYEEPASPPPVLPSPTATRQASTPAPQPEDKYTREQLDRFGFDNLERFGVKACESFGIEAILSYGIENCERYGLDYIERFGLQNLKDAGVDACLKYGRSAIESYPLPLLERYGTATCEKYPTDLLSLYSPDILDVWPHALLREFPLDLLIRHPIDLLRRYAPDILDKYPADILRKYSMEIIEFYGTPLLQAFSMDVLKKWGKEICSEALAVQLEPAIVAAYHAEKEKRRAMIQHVEEELVEIAEKKAQVIEFVSLAPNNPSANVSAAASRRASPLGRDTSAAVTSHSVRGHGAAASATASASVSPAPGAASSSSPALPAAAKRHDRHELSGGAATAGAEGGLQPTSVVGRSPPPV